jgi:hypothetical protein
MCGVRTRFGAPASGESAGSGSVAKTSSAAPPSRPASSAWASAASSITPPRAVLIRTAPGFMPAMRAASIRFRVSATSGTCSVTASAAASSSSSEARVTPASRQTGASAGIIASAATTFMPRPCASFATSRPIPPKPTMPSVLPAASRPSPSGPRGHFPDATAAVER